MTLIRHIVLKSLNNMKQLHELKEEILKGKYDERLLDVYVDETLLEHQRQRYHDALEQFEKLYGNQEVEIYSAPGRSEVGGNHTDHQHGKVIAASINLDCIAIVSKTNDQQIKIVSDDFDIAPILLDDLTMKDKEVGTSEALVRGVASRLVELGYNVGGFNAYMTSEVLMGAGLSSSAAFEVIVGTVISGLFNEMRISPVLIAQVGQYAENVYFKKPCGLMDQMASSVGAIINIDFEDTNNPIIQKVDVDFSAFQHSLCIVDTKGSHADLTDDYAAIPAEMKKIANHFGKSVLREVKEEDFYKELPRLRERYSDRAVLRAMHLFEENKRVDKEVAALKTGDFNMFLWQVKLSGDSSYKFLQNVYSNGDVHQQSVSIGLAISEKVLGEEGACRVHGGGFAGTIQAFVPDYKVKEYQDTIEYVFGKGTCHILKVRKYGGIQVI